MFGVANGLESTALFGSRVDPFKVLPCFHFLPIDNPHTSMHPTHPDARIYQQSIGFIVQGKIIDEENDTKTTEGHLDYAL